VIVLVPVGLAAVSAATCLTPLCYSFVTWREQPGGIPPPGICKS